MKETGLRNLLRNWVCMVRLILIADAGLIRTSSIVTGKAKKSGFGLTALLFNLHIFETSSP
ncbi:hypothetical protein KP77_05400 [Jeotgalibacillus alimentarius]|uniref:Uncharacterized protein n=1 Tax=Jeotgalibacillus alimentarius TaxID=135826 RepID=A0A0C2SI01_9BACL|nr:hypothetical protein KP77_05400 [Jeotgalibacillus alimentarius]